MMKDAVELCFQGIQVTSRHQAKSILRDSGLDSTEEEWERATCVIRHRRGAQSHGDCDVNG
jgi:hypothetical protein